MTRHIPKTLAVLATVMGGCGDDPGNTPPPATLVATGGWQSSAGGGAGTLGGGGMPSTGGTPLSIGGATIGGAGGQPPFGSGGEIAAGGAVALGGMTGNGGIPPLSGDGGAPPMGDGGAPPVGDGGAPPMGGGGAPPADDGCTDTPVAGLSLTALDAYQTVQIRIMEEGTGVGPSGRNAGIVAGRETVFRVHVTPEAGWTPRKVSARIELTDAQMGNPSQVFFGTLTPTGASSDADLDSTLQVKVPAGIVGPDMGYAVTLVECDGSPPGAPAARARFPSEGYEQLAALETGPLKVHIIPISGTDISQAGLEPFKERVEAVYPITEVQFTIGDPLIAFAGSMCNLLASVTSRRSQDSPPNDVYYYGLAPGILGGQSGCSTTSTSARSGKVSAGWAQGFTRDDGRTGAGTMCHELGHAHGRYHAPCNVQDPDPRYPYPGADIGVWGYDHRSGEFLEPTRKDMMSYCPEPRWAAWVSDYNYQAILARTLEVNAVAEVPALLDEPGTLGVSWRLLVSDSAGIHWAQEPLLGTPEGEPVRAVVHGEDGPMQQVEVYRQWLEDGVVDGAFMLTVPQPEPGWHAIEVPGLLAPQVF